jgi:hypothetical protein
MERKGKDYFSLSVVPEKANKEVPTARGRCGGECENAYKSLKQ